MGYKQGNIETNLISNACFIPAKDIDDIVPGETGFYCIRLSIDSFLPEKYQAIMNQGDQRIIYKRKAHGNL